MEKIQFNILREIFHPVEIKSDEDERYNPVVLNVDGERYGFPFEAKMALRLLDEIKESVERKGGFDLQDISNHFPF